MRTAVLVSGGGLNLQAILDAHTFGELPGCELAAVISSDPEAYALRRAAMAGVEHFVVERELFENEKEAVGRERGGDHVAEDRE